ncbi:MAG: cupin domain-containing protein [Halobacteriota archaeon]
MRSSKAELPVTSQGDGLVFRETTWGTMHVEMPTFDKEFDVAPLLKGLPDDMTPAPQWGYVFTGSIHVTYKDGAEEVVNTGDVFYAAPGHTLKYEAGMEFVMFSPAEYLKTVAPVMYRNIAARQQER